MDVNQFKIAIVPVATSVPTSRIVEVAAAIQKQISDHVAYYWRRNATVVYAPNEANLDGSYWRVQLYDRIDQSVLGYHIAPHNNQPYAVVQTGEDWEVTCSHEVIELVIDPWGNSIASGPTIAPNTSADVEYLIEVCDPCQFMSYPIGNVKVAEFVTPQYYDFHAPAGSKFSYPGSIEQPLDILPDGYLHLHDKATNAWYQARKPQGQIQISYVGYSNPVMGSLRASVDAMTRKSGLLPASSLRPRSEKSSKKVKVMRPHTALQGVDMLIKEARKSKKGVRR